MSKAILKFNLPEDQEDYFNASNGYNYRNCLSELDNHLRNELKYNDKLIEVESNKIEEIRSKLLDLLLENNVTL